MIIYELVRLIDYYDSWKTVDDIVRYGVVDSDK